MSEPTLGVMALYLSNKGIEELSFFRKLCLEGHKRGMKVMIFTPEDILPSHKEINALYFDAERQKWYRKRSSFPTLIYDRCRHQKTYRFQQLKQFRTKYKQLTYMNHPLSFKWGVHQLLSKNKNILPHLPHTIQCQHPDDIKQFLKKYSLVYLKPIDGTGGRGIVRIKRLADSMVLIEGRDQKRQIITPQKMMQEQISERLSTWGLRERYLIQQGINISLKDGRVYDFRLLIQKNGSGEWEVTGCAGRIGPVRSITSNLHGGGCAAPMLKLLRSRFTSEERVMEIKKTMESLSHQVVKELENRYGRLCEMALDIAVDPEGHVWLLEVNPKPAREVFHRLKEHKTYLSSITRPLEYAQWLLKRKQQ